MTRCLDLSTIMAQTIYFVYDQLHQPVQYDVFENVSVMVWTDAYFISVHFPLGHIRGGSVVCQPINLQLSLCRCGGK